MERDAAASDLVSPTCDGDHNGYSSSKSCAEKKLRLFGFELDPNKNGSVEGDHDSVNSSSSSTTANSPGRQKRNQSVGTKKFECQYCFKEFANSQALGGHQNAHKRERMKKKRLQLLARKASTISYYNLHDHPYYRNSSHGTFTYYHHASSPPWFNYCDRHEDSQISFRRFDQNAHLNEPYVSNLVTIPIFQQDTCMFTLTHNKAHHQQNETPKPNCKSLDLQLGLSEKYPISDGE